MNKKYEMAQTLASALMFFLVLATVGGYGFAEEKAVTSSNGIPKWRKVAVLKNAIGGIDSISWCGKSSIVYFYEIPHVTSQDPGYIVFRGGFKLYDVKTGKEHSIIKDIMTGRPFCNADGSFVYWFGGKKFKEREKKSENATLLSGYDTKTGHIWQDTLSSKVIDNRYVLPYLLPSPTNNIMLIYMIPFNDDKQGRLEDLLKKLPEWRMMRIPFTAMLCHYIGGDWARDGGYFYLKTTDANTGRCRIAIYDANGRLKLYPDPPFKVKDEYFTVIIKGVYYVLDPKANLLIMTDIETASVLFDLKIEAGEKRTYPVPEGTLGFDISSKGEVVYWTSTRKEKGPNIYFANKLGDKPRLLEHRSDGVARFSPDGEYFYFSAGGEWVVLKRE